MRKTTITALTLTASLALTGCMSAAQAGETADMAKIDPLENATVAAVTAGQEELDALLQHADEAAARAVEPCEEEDSTGCVWVADERGNGQGTSFVADEQGTVHELTHDEARAVSAAPAAEPSAAPAAPSAEPTSAAPTTPSAAPASVEEQEQVHADETRADDWQWSQLLEDEAYHWPVCATFEQLDCVWVASYMQERGHEESFLSLSDGSVIPLNEQQARAMAGH